MFKKISLLPPEALKYLLKQIETMPDEQPDKHKMLKIADIARKALKKLDDLTKDEEKRQFNIRRYFYLPFNKIIFSGDLDRRQAGRVSRDSMRKIWDYIETKLMPDEVDELEMAFKASIQAKQMKKAKIIVNEFNRLAGQKLKSVISKCRDNDREWARFAMVIGNKKVARDAEELSEYLQNTEELENIMKFFSVEIPDLSGNVLNRITKETLKIKENTPHLFPFYAATLIDSLKHPAHVLRVIQKHYRIDDASAAASCDLAILGNILLFNAQIGANNFIKSTEETDSPEQYLEHYRQYSDIILGLEREFDVSTNSSWGKQIIQLKENISEALKKHIISCPSQLKNILGRYQMVVDGVVSRNPTTREIEQLKRSVYMLHGIRNYIAATSSNAIFRDYYPKCLQFIDVYSVGIVEQIRRGSIEKKNKLLPYLEISGELIKIVKDEQQAAVYLKGGMLAMRIADTEPTLP